MTRSGAKPPERKRQREEVEFEKAYRAWWGLPTAEEEEQSEMENYFRSWWGMTGEEEEDPIAGLSQPVTIPNSCPTRLGRACSYPSISPPHQPHPSTSTTPDTSNPPTPISLPPLSKSQERNHKRRENRMLWREKKKVKRLEKRESRLVKELESLKEEMEEHRASSAE